MEAEVYKAIDKINEQYLLCDHDFTRPYHDKEFIANLNYFKLVWPEVDTIRFAIPSGHAFDVPRFVQNEFKSQISTIQRRFDENGNPAFDVFGRPDFVTMWAKCRIDEMNKSSYGKMQIFQGKLGSDFDKNAPIALIIEFSVAKWHNNTNGVNRGVKASFEDCIRPIFEALDRLNAVRYTWFHHVDVSTGETVFDKQYFEDWIRQNIVLRRLDLSYNFKVENVDIVMHRLATCRLNNVDANAKQSDFDLDNVKDVFKELKKHQKKLEIDDFEQKLDGLKNQLAEAATKFETVSFGGGRGSEFKAMFYDKAKEQKKYFSNYANAVVKNPLDPFSKMNDLKARKEFYKKNAHFFEKTVRFEVQYNSKFFIEKVKERYKRERGQKMIENLIYICENHWAQTLKKFDEQLGINVNEHLDRYENIEKVFNHLDTLAECNYISRTVANNLKGFIQDCWKFDGGWMGVRAHIGQQNFSAKYLKLKKLTGFDVKRECLRDMPIMRSMLTNGLYSANYWRNRAEKQIFFDYGNYVKFA